MNILVDSSVWIDYFRNGDNSPDLDFLIDENQIVLNDMILAELIPFLKVKRETRLINLLNAVKKVEINIDWQGIIDLQTKCLKNGINVVGIPDLIIVQNVIRMKLKIYTLDKHFKLISEHIPLKLY
jgi:hypothetical protein